MSVNPIKDDVEYLWELAGRTEQYAQNVISANPALTGDLLTRANAAAAACTAARTVLQNALNKLGAGAVPPGPVDFWYVLTAASKAKDVLVVVQSTLADIDRKQRAATGRELQTFPRAETERPGIIQQVGVTAKWLAVLVGVGALAMVVSVIVRR